MRFCFNQKISSPTIWRPYRCLRTPLCVLVGQRDSVIPTPQQCSALWKCKRMETFRSATVQVNCVKMPKY